jgi:hypothetical protein
MNRDDGHPVDRFTGDDLPFSRLEELLADRAAGPLTGAEATELRQLLNRAGKADDQSLDLAAAALDRALADTQAESLDSVPASLIARIEGGGEAWCVAVKNAEESVLARVGSRVGERVDQVMDSRVVRTPVVMGHRYLREWSGWVAAAACVAIGGLMYLNRPIVEIHTVKNVQGPAPKVMEATIVPSDLVVPVQRFAEDLGARAMARLNRFMSGTTTDLLHVPIAKAVPDASGDVRLGEVIWNRTDGTGVVRIGGLTPDITATGQKLQLWVFDSARGQRHPINGGLIPLTPGQTEVLVPLDPSMPVTDAAAFVVTLESEQGSIVAERDRMLALGLVAAGEGMAPPPVFLELPTSK